MTRNRNTPEPMMPKPKALPPSLITASAEDMAGICNGLLRDGWDVSELHLDREGKTFRYWLTPSPRALADYPQHRFIVLDDVPTTPEVAFWRRN